MTFTYKATDGNWYFAKSATTDWNGASGVGPFNSLEDVQGSVALLVTMNAQGDRVLKNYGDAGIPAPMSVISAEACEEGHRIES